MLRAQSYRLPTPPTRRDFRNRNAIIRAAYASGMSLSELAALYDISYQRISQIVNYRHH